MLDSLALALAAQAMAPDPALLAEMQALESVRNAAIRAGDARALERIYAADFNGIAANGASVDRDALLAVFRRNAGGDFSADSRILSARREGDLVLVEGRLILRSRDGTRLLSHSRYLHIFRRSGGDWRMIGGAAVPMAEADR